MTRRHNRSEWTDGGRNRHRPAIRQIRLPIDASIVGSPDFEPRTDVEKHHAKRMILARHRGFGLRSSYPDERSAMVRRGTIARQVHASRRAIMGSTFVARRAGM